jgi:hypothetical protein
VRGVRLKNLLLPLLPTLLVAFAVHLPAQEAGFVAQLPPPYLVVTSVSFLPAAVAQSPRLPQNQTEDQQQHQQQPGTPAPKTDVKPSNQVGANGEPIPVSKQQPKRILGIMPNYRAVSAGALPPPPTPKEAFKIATRNSFDYSAFIFVAITSAFAYSEDSHPRIGTSASAYWGYYWRGFVDKTDGNYLVVFVLPTVFHQDERYYALGTGSVWKRGVYAASRILITPNYHGHASFNASDVFGRAMAQIISTTYYPRGSTTLGELAVKYGYAIGRDALTNVFREFWPDIATHVLHRHP